jgi:hypothetical protein
MGPPGIPAHFAPGSRKSAGQMAPPVLPHGFIADLDLRRSSCQVAEAQSSERAELWNFPTQIHAKKALHEFGEIFVCSLIFQLAIG